VANNWSVPRLSATLLSEGTKKAALLYIERL